jgi:hypothetical protein
VHRSRGAGRRMRSLHYCVSDATLLAVFAFGL